MSISAFETDLVEPVGALPQQHLVAVTAEELPTPVCETFAVIALRTFGVPLRQPRYEGFWGLTHPPGDSTYFAQHRGNYPGNTDSATLVDLVDYNMLDGLSVGSGQIMLSLSSNSPRLANIPFVNRTDTFEGRRGVGLGRRRVLTMGKATLELFDLPLHSGMHWESDYAEKIWKHLVTDGLAEEFTELICGAVPAKRYRLLP